MTPAHVGRQYSNAHDAPPLIALACDVVDIRGEVRAMKTTHSDVDHAATQCGAIIRRRGHSGGERRQP